MIVARHIFGQVKRQPLLSDVSFGYQPALQLPPWTPLAADVAALAGRFAWAGAVISQAAPFNEGQPYYTTARGCNLLGTVTIAQLADMLVAIASNFTKWPFVSSS